MANQTLRQQRMIRAAYARKRSALRARHAPAIPRAAHPHVAGALASLGARFSDTARRVVDNGFVIAAALAAACGFLYARSAGLFP